MTRDRGITLIELVVAMAIFALVAIMGLQALTGMLRQRDRLTGIDAQNAEISATMVRMRRDLTAAVPVLFQPPQGGLQPAFMAFSGDLRMMAAEQPALDGARGFQRIEWRYDPTEQALMRRIWTDATDPSATQAMPWVPYLHDVSAFRATVLRDAAIGADTDVGGVSDALPRGIDVEIVVPAGTLRLFEVLQ